MKVNKDFVLREIAGESILVPLGQQTMQMDGIINLNPVAAVIWSALSENPDQEYVLQEILEHFDIDEVQVRKDLQEFIDEMKVAGMLEDVV